MLTMEESSHTNSVLVQRELYRILGEVSPTTPESFQEIYVKLPRKLVSDAFMEQPKFPLGRSLEQLVEEGSAIIKMLTHLGLQPTRRLLLAP